MKKIYLIGSSLCLAMIFNACGGGNVVNPVINPNLPEVLNIKTKSSMNAIAFEWNTVKPNENSLNFNKDSIEGFKIYKSEKQDAPKKLIATIDNKYSTHYVDTNLKPSTVYYYEIASYDKSGISKPILKEARTKDKLPPIAFVQSITNLPNMIKIIWRPHDDVSVKKYNIYRNKIDSSEWRKIATIEGRLNVEYIDKVKAGEHFRYEVSAETFDGVESDRSYPVDSHSKVLPSKVINLSATNNAPKKIILTWDMGEIKDFSHFKIYEKGFLGSTVIATTKNNTYSVEVDKDGLEKTYEVSIVDNVGLEGDKASVTGNSLAKPSSPQITRARLVGDKVDLAWFSTDQRARKFRIIREDGKEKKVFADIEDTSFEDTTITQGKTYYYYVISIDDFGIESELSTKAVAQ